MNAKENILNDFLQRPIAHRGLHNKEHGIVENTLLSFEKAIAEDFAIELDVRLTKDGCCVVFHDSTLARLTNSTKTISEVTVSELNKITLKGTTDKIPTLVETLNFIKGRVPILIEIKNEKNVGGLEEAVLETINNYSGAIAIQSFNPHTIHFFKKKRPEIIRGQLTGLFENENMVFFKKIILKNLLFTCRNNPDFIAADYRMLTDTAVIFHRKILRKPVFAWTIRDENIMNDSLKLSDNIIFEGFIPHAQLGEYS